MKRLISSFNENRRRKGRCKKVQVWLWWVKLQHELWMSGSCYMMFDSEMSKNKLKYSLRVSTLFILHNFFLFPTLCFFPSLLFIFFLLLLLSLSHPSCLLFLYFSSSSLHYFYYFYYFTVSSLGYRDFSYLHKRFSIVHWENTKISIAPNPFHIKLSYVTRILYGNVLRDLKIVGFMPHEIPHIYHSGEYIFFEGT